MLPKHLVVAFWEEVRERLEKEHGLDRQTAHRYIDIYCERMSQHGGFEMVYHENPADVARGLSHGGVLEPEPTREQRKFELLKHHPALADMLPSNSQ